jgi:hypothetical protein
MPDIVLAVADTEHLASGHATPENTWWLIYSHAHLRIKYVPIGVTNAIKGRS